jgi:2-dehydropantoate 2-reductase
MTHASPDRPMRIAVVGAGAIGGWLAARLSGSGQAVSVLARGKTLEAIGQTGIRLIEHGKTRTVRPFVSDKPSELGPQDLIIVAVKSPALADIAPLVAQMFDAETCVLPAVNGVPWWFTEGLGEPLEGQPIRSVDPHGSIAKHIPPSRVIGCAVHASSSTRGPGQIDHNTGNRLIIGEPIGTDTARLQKVASLLRNAHFDVSISNRIQQDVWYKLWGNMTMNPISALTGATADKILDDDLLHSLILKIMAEAAEIGRRIGCPIAESGEDRMKVTRKLGAFKTSMLQDVEAGRPLEIDALLAAPREIAVKVGVETPYMDALLGLTRLFATHRNSTRL